MKRPRPRPKARPAPRRAVSRSKPAPTPPSRSAPHRAPGEAWLVAEAADSAEGARAGLELGLRRLFMGRDLEGATEALRAAARAEEAPHSRTARATLGRLLLASGRPQQAAFEFRKVVASAIPTDLVGIQARAGLVEALHGLGKGREAEQLRAESVKDLERLMKEPGVDGAIAAAWLGFEKKHDGDREGAKVALKRALERPELPEAERAAAQAALDAL